MQTKVGLVVLAMSSTVFAQPKQPPLPPEPQEFEGPVSTPVIEVLDPSKTMTAPFVRTAILKVEPGLVACARKAKWAGTAFAWMVTDWRGKVTKLELAVDSAAVEKCLTKVMKTIVVANTQVRATTFVKFVVNVAVE